MKKLREANIDFPEDDEDMKNIEEKDKNYKEWENIWIFKNMNKYPLIIYYNKL